jgi:MFS family permease
MAVFSLTILLLEIPSGVLADLIGKKKTLLIARFLYIIEIAIMAFGNGFWPFLIAKILSGIGTSMTSGTTSAFLYDTLKRMNREKDYVKISGTVWAITNTSMAFVFITGAWLFTIDNKLPAILSLPLVTLGWILTFFTEEPYPPKAKLTVSNSWKHLKEGLTYTWNHKYLKYLILFSLPIGTTAAILMNTTSAYYEAIGVPVAFIGTIAFANSIISAITGKKVHKIEKLTDRQMLRLIEIIMITSIFLLALMKPYIGIIFYFGIFISFGLYMVLVDHITQKHIETSHRATVTSIKNMAENVGIFMLFPIFGYIAKINMQSAITVLGTFMLVYAIVLYFYANKNLGELKN